MSASDKHWNQLKKMVEEEHVIFERAHCENMVCANHEHIYWQGNEAIDNNQCQIPYQIWKQQNLLIINHHNRSHNHNHKYKRSHN
jgi:hypothetical protein